MGLDERIRRARGRAVGAGVGRAAAQHRHPFADRVGLTQFRNHVGVGRRIGRGAAPRPDRRGRFDPFHFGPVRGFVDLFRRQPHAQFRADRIVLRARHEDVPFAEFARHAPLVRGIEQRDDAFAVRGGRIRQDPGYFVAGQILAGPGDGFGFGDPRQRRRRSLDQQGVFRDVAVDDRPIGFQRGEVLRADRRRHLHQPRHGAARRRALRDRRLRGGFQEMERRLLHPARGLDGAPGQPQRRSFAPGRRNAQEAARQPKCETPLHSILRRKTP